MIKRPTNKELDEWEHFGSYAGSEAVRRLIAEVRRLRKKIAKTKKDCVHVKRLPKALGRQVAEYASDGGWKKLAANTLDKG